MIDGLSIDQQKSDSASEGDETLVTDLTDSCLRRMMNTKVLALENVTKKFSSRTVLSELSFRIEPGTVTGIVGINGAGKTTTIAILSGQLAPDNGAVTLDGKEQHPDALARITALIPESPHIYPTLTPREHLRFVALGRRLGVSADVRAEQLAARFALTPYLDQPAGTLSKGNRQKTLIACALLADTPFVLFDEPFIGLDPPAQTEVLAILDEMKNLARGIVITTHMLDFAVRSCDRIIALRQGDVTFMDAGPPLETLERLRSVFAP